MNEIQQRTFAHLTDPEGSGQRGQALAVLTRKNFFTQATEEQSRGLISDFIEEYGPNGRGDFCDEGIGRFLEAVGIEDQVSGSEEEDVFLYLNFRLIRDADCETGMGEVMEKIAAVAKLTQNGENWRIEGMELGDWGEV